MLYIVVSAVRLVNCSFIVSSRVFIFRTVIAYNRMFQIIEMTPESKVKVRNN